VAERVTAGDRIRLTLRRSLIGRPEDQRKIVRALGLRRVGATRVHVGTLALAGALRRVGHLLSIEEVDHGRDR
jgi:large subunit ribosomal protein L30